MDSLQLDVNLRPGDSESLHAHVSKQTHPAFMSSLNLDMHARGQEYPGHVVNNQTTIAASFPTVLKTESYHEDVRLRAIEESSVETRRTIFGEVFYPRSRRSLFDWHPGSSPSPDEAPWRPPRLKTE